MAGEYIITLIILKGSPTMKIISFILALVLVCSLFGCAAKEDINKEENETTLSDTKAENENKETEKSDPAEDDKDTGSANGTESVGGTVDTDAADTKEEPADTDAVTDKEENDKETSAPPKDKETSSSADTEDKKPEVTEGLADYTDGMIIEAHLYNVSGHFSSDYKRGEGHGDAKLIHITALFLYTQRQRLVEISEDKSRFSVSGETLEENMKLLFGKDLNLADFASDLDGAMGDKYDEESDTYSFDVYRANWGEGSYVISMDHPMDFKDKTKTLTISATLINSKGKTKEATYKFTKVVSDGYLYFRLDEVDVK